MSWPETKCSKQYFEKQSVYDGWWEEFLPERKFVRVQFFVVVEMRIAGIIQVQKEAAD